MQTRTEQVTPLFEDALARIANDNDQLLSWDYSITLMPTPQGPMGCGLLTIFARSPLLGQPDLCTSDIQPLQMVPLNQTTMDNTVRAALDTLRNVRADLLATQQ